MKVLHVSNSDLRGGAARAAYRIHSSMVEEGLDSRMVVAEKVSQDPRVIQFRIPFCMKKNEAVSFLLSLQKSQNAIAHSLNLFSSGLHKFINNSDADVVNLHWINQELLSIAELSKINKKIVWTLHDMWAFSGAEHYDDLQHPARYKEGYLPGNRPKSHIGRVDMDKWCWDRKCKHWFAKDFHIVTPSKWLGDCAKQSALFKRRPVSVVPYSIDLDVFKPFPKDFARSILKIRPETSLIMFGADVGLEDIRKGGDLLVNALEAFSKSGSSLNCEVVVFGSGNQHLPNKLAGFRFKSMGRIVDDLRLAALYSAADVFVAPSRQDNLPNTIIESLACGTPCVAFDIGGMPDMIDHEKTGYLAQPFNADDLASGIKWAIEAKQEGIDLNIKVRKSAVQKFAREKVVDGYLKVYNQVLSV